MKILHIVHQYAPDFIGGTELYTAKLASEQAKRGDEIAIFVPAPRPVSASTQDVIQDLEDGIQLYRVCVGERSAGRVFADTVRGSAKILAGFRRVLADFQPDVVHIQHLMGVGTAVGSLLVEANIPYVVTLHDYWYGCANAQLFTNYDQTVCGGPDRFFVNCGRCALARAGLPHNRAAGSGVAPLMAYRQRQAHLVLAKASAVIAPTHFVRHIYQEMGISTTNFIYIPHGIERPEALITAACANAPQRRAIHSEKFRVVYIGGISPQKGLHTLVEAFNRLPVDASLTIYGDLTKFPDYVTKLRQLISHPAVKLAGRLPHEEIWGETAASDLVVMPTHWYEASPLTIDEVFTVGTPLLASNLGAMTEKIEHQVNGWLVPPGDTAAWEKALQQFYTDEELLGRLRENIRPGFTLQRHVEQVQAVYRRGM